MFFVSGVIKSQIEDSPYCYTEEVHLLSSDDSNLRSSLKKIALVILLTIIVSASVIYAFWRPTNQETTVEAAFSSYPLHLSVELEKQQFARGETIYVKCSLRNIGNENVTITFFSMRTEGEGKDSFPVCFGYEISDTNNTTIYAYYQDKGFLATLWTLVLVPREEVTQTMCWDQKLGYPDYLPADGGTYFIRATAPSHEKFSLNNGPVTKLETPPIAFTIG